MKKPNMKDWSNQGTKHSIINEPKIKEGMKERQGMKQWTNQGMQHEGNEGLRKEGVKQTRNDEWRNEGTRNQRIKTLSAAWNNEGMERKEWSDGMKNQTMKQWKNDGIKECRNKGMKEWRDEGIKDFNLWNGLKQAYLPRQTLAMDLWPLQPTPEFRVRAFTFPFPTF